MNLNRLTLEEIDGVLEKSLIIVPDCRSSFWFKIPAICPSLGISGL